MKDQIRNFIIEKFLFGEGTVADDEQLFESGTIDSMGFMELISYIEKTFNVSMDMAEISMDKFSTINDIVETINSKQKT